MMKLVNLLPAFVLVCTTACATELPLERVSGSFSFPTRGELNVERRFVIRSHSEWETQWARISPKLYDPSGRPVKGRELPRIDFSRQMILIAEMGLKGSGGFHVSIRRVIDRGTFIQVPTVDVDAPKDDNRE